MSYMKTHLNSVYYHFLPNKWPNCMQKMAKFAWIINLKIAKIHHNSPNVKMKKMVQDPRFEGILSIYHVQTAKIDPRSKIWVYFHPISSTNTQNSHESQILNQILNFNVSWYMVYFVNFDVRELSEFCRFFGHLLGKEW